MRHDSRNKGITAMHDAGCSLNEILTGLTPAVLFVILIVIRIPFYLLFNWRLLSFSTFSH